MDEWLAVAAKRVMAAAAVKPEQAAAMVEVLEEIQREQAEGREIRLDGLLIRFYGRIGCDETEARRRTDAVLAAPVPDLRGKLD